VSDTSPSWATHTSQGVYAGMVVVGLVQGYSVATEWLPRVAVAATSSESEGEQ
jgi:hypothetical protein